MTQVRFFAHIQTPAKNGQRHLSSTYIAGRSNEDKYHKILKQALSLVVFCSPHRQMVDTIQSKYLIIGTAAHWKQVFVNLLPHILNICVYILVYTIQYIYGIHHIVCRPCYCLLLYFVYASWRFARDLYKNMSYTVTLIFCFVDDHYKCILWTRKVNFSFSH